MIPVHIWSDTRQVDLRDYPEHFYEHAGGRGSNFLRPIIHTRYKRLNYNHVGDFANTCLSKKGEAAVHIFTISHRDLLEGPTNDALGQICELIIKTALISTRLVVMFVAFIPVAQLTPEQLATATKTRERVDKVIGMVPSQVIWYPAQVVPDMIMMSNFTVNSEFRHLFYQELTKAVNRIVLKDSNIQLKVENQ